jgi:di/tricarboxylate transporter
MTPAVYALLALLAVLALSMTTRVNVGLLAITVAWFIGVYAAGLKPDAVIAGFPANLFLTLAGVTLLFAVARANGTLELIAAAASRLAGGSAAAVAWIFFLLAGALSSVGPGAIASVALVAPIGMAVAARGGIPNLLMAIMIATGANAGNLSPVSAVGAMANSLMLTAGIPPSEGKVWAANLIAHIVVAAAAWFLFGGWKLLRERSRVEAAAAHSTLSRQHGMTIAVIVVWMCAVIFWRVQVGLSAIAAATALVLVRAADEQAAIRMIPLDVILMVTGVTVLIGVLETTGGLDLFTGMIGRVADASSINAVIAFITGVISTYSSTSGVVLPAFLPMVPGLVRETGAASPLGVALSINVGASLVDVSPLSTLGALCVAAVADKTSAGRLFRQLLLWGLSMCVVGAVLCALFANWFASL